MGRRLFLGLAAILAVVVLWGAYALLIGLVLSALPESGSAAAVLHWWAAGLATAWVGGFAALYPRALDGILRPRWIPFEEAGDVGPLVLDVLARSHLPTPRLGVVVNEEPLVLTYGLTRAGARMVVSSGLLRSMGVDGQSALLCREVGHLQHRDFVAVTVLATPVALLSRLVDALLLGRQSFPSSSGSSGLFVAPLLEVLISMHLFILAPLARLRAVEADAFALRALEETGTGGERPARQVLAEALGGMARGLARPLPKPRQRGEGLAHLLRGFTPVDATHAGRVATWSACNGRLTAEDFQRAVDRLEDNPFARCTSWDSLHPILPARLGPGTGTGVPREAGERLRRHRLVHALPLLGFLVGLVLSLVLHGYVGLCLLGWGLARLGFVCVEFIRPRQVVPRDEVERVLELSSAPWGESWRVDLEGTLVGLGVPGVTRCPDAVLRTGRVYLPVRLRLPFGQLQAFPQQQRLGLILGEKVQALGLLRFRDVPYVEVHRLVVKGSTWYSSGFVAVHLFVSFLLVLFGVLLILPQWLGI